MVPTPPQVRDRHAPKPQFMQPKRVIPLRRGKRIDPATARARFIARYRAERKRQRELTKNLALLGRTISDELGLSWIRRHLGS